MIIEICKIQIRCDDCSVRIDIPERYNRTGGVKHAVKQGWARVRRSGELQHLCPACAVAHRIAADVQKHGPINEPF
jgi:Zn finger protein HypA/HybF involved in hydrogenase expression